ncbi:MAG TPA: 16S rRNA (cytosine(1402)-N(4))-methyltransferase, partial [Acidobacteria bacterium]|nr:16S rRNA (cytosine(1402)-N(4))-methyltransferase [Acidobacteriota bacterium]
ALERGGEVAIRVLTKRPVIPQDEEVERNPRARSAKLRVAERVA